MEQFNKAKNMFVKIIICLLISSVYPSMIDEFKAFEDSSIAYGGSYEKVSGDRKISVKTTKNGLTRVIIKKGKDIISEFILKNGKFHGKVLIKNDSSEIQGIFENGTGYLEENNNSNLRTIDNLIDMKTISRITLLPGGDTLYSETFDDDEKTNFKKKMGVSGVKSHKWGDSIPKTRKKYSSWIPIEKLGYEEIKFARPFKNEAQSGTKVFVVDDYSIGNIKTHATFQFIENKLIKIVIVIPADILEIVDNSLINKYGSPEDLITNENAIISMEKDLIGKKNDIGFYNNTIQLKQEIGFGLELVNCLIYQPIDYKETITNKLKTKIENGL